MHLRGFRVEGLAGLPRIETRDLGRIVRLSGSARALGALSLALDLGFAAFSVADARAAAARAGWVPGEVLEEKGRPVQVELGRPAAVTPLVDDGEPRALRVGLDLALDPPQLEILRRAALRNPELGPAVLGHAPLVLHVGWLFSSDCSVASVSILNARLGDTSLSLVEPPDWFAVLLDTLSGRFGARRAGELDVAGLAAAQRSPEAGAQARWRAFRTDLAGRPFGHELTVVDHGDEVVLALLPDLAPLDSHGAAVAEDVGLVAAVHVLDRELLFLDGPGALGGSSRRRWLARQVEGDGSVLEQLFLADVPGKPDVQVG